MELVAGNVAYRSGAGPIPFPLGMGREIPWIFPNRDEFISTSFIHFQGCYPRGVDFNIASC